MRLSRYHNPSSPSGVDDPDARARRRWHIALVAVARWPIARVAHRPGRCPLTGAPRPRRPPPPRWRCHRWGAVRCRSRGCAATRVRGGAQDQRLLAGGECWRRAKPGGRRTGRAGAAVQSRSGRAAAAPRVSDCPAPSRSDSPARAAVRTLPLRAWTRARPRTTVARQPRHAPPGPRLVLGCHITGMPRAWQAARRLRPQLAFHEPTSTVIQEPCRPGRRSAKRCSTRRFRRAPGGPVPRAPRQTRPTSRCDRGIGHGFGGYGQHRHGSTWFRRHWRHAARSARRRPWRVIDAATFRQPARNLLAPQQSEPRRRLPSRPTARRAGSAAAQPSACSTAAVIASPIAGTASCQASRSTAMVGRHTTTPRPNGLGTTIRSHVSTPSSAWFARRRAAPARPAAPWTARAIRRDGDMITAGQQVQQGAQAFGAAAR